MSILYQLGKKWIKVGLVGFLSVFYAFVGHVSATELNAVDIYTQDQLIDLIRNKQYLQQVKRDDCQLVQDIEARAEVLTQPLYQFLWAEMLNHGVCVKKDPPRGISLLMDAANQGSAEAMLKIAEYYHDGQFVVQDKERAVHYVFPAAASGDLPSRMMLVKLFGQGYGSPRDYEVGYHWLYNDVFSDEQTKAAALELLKKLETKMPASAIDRAKQKFLTLQ